MSGQAETTVPESIAASCVPAAGETFINSLTFSKLRLPKAEIIETLCLFRVLLFRESDNRVAPRIAMRISKRLITPEHKFRGNEYGYAEISLLLASLYRSQERWTRLSAMFMRSVNARWEKRERSFFIFPEKSFKWRRKYPWQKRLTALHIVESSRERRNQVSAITFGRGATDLWTLHLRACSFLPSGLYAPTATLGMQIVRLETIWISHERITGVQQS